MRPIDVAKWWFSKDVAEAIGVTAAHVRRLSDEGKIPFRWMLGHRRYDPRVIRALLAGSSKRTGRAA